MHSDFQERPPVRQVEKLIKTLYDGGVRDERVLAAISRVPRHVFVDPALRYRAYEDVALPISESQTISQPSVVALMTEKIAARRSLKSVLEIGTGCGYQTAILSQLFNRVCTIERIRSLSMSASARLKALGIRNVEFQHGDGFLGWRERAPFDAIIVTAAADEPPRLLLDQLASDGVIVLPVGGQSDVQSLTVVRKVLGETLFDEVCPVKFVPLLRGVRAGDSP